MSHAHDLHISSCQNGKWLLHTARRAGAGVRLAASDLFAVNLMIPMEFAPPPPPPVPFGNLTAPS